MKGAIFCLLALVATQGAYGRQLMQLPTLPQSTPTPDTSSIPAPAPAPSASLAGSTCALEYLVNAGNFNTLIELVEAASDSADISQLLDSDESMVTLLAPTDAGIQNAIGAVGGIEALLSDPSRISDILNYHLLSSQIQITDLVDGYSFNTELTADGVAQSVAVRGSGSSATFVGKSSEAASAGQIATACNTNIIPINGLLVP